MSARLASWALPLAGLLLAASPARAQEEPPEGPPPAPAPLPAPAPPGGCTVVVVLPGTSCTPPVIVQGPPPVQVQVQPPPPPVQPLPPGAYYPYPYPPLPYGPPPVLPRPRRTQFTAKLWAGPSYQKLYDISLYGVDFGVSLGGQRGISGWYGEMQGIIGKTDHGLSTYQYWMGPTWEAKLDRVHLGLGMHFGVAGIARATTGSLMSGLGLGIFGFASVDVYQSEEGHALYVGARMTGNWVDGGSDSAMLWGPSATLGWRY